MNRPQQVASTQVAPKTKRLFDPKDRTLAKPIMKRSLIVLAFWALTAYHSNAAGSESSIWPHRRNFENLSTNGAGMG